MKFTKDYGSSNTLKYNFVTLLAILQQRGHPWSESTINKAEIRVFLCSVATVIFWMIRNFFEVIIETTNGNSSLFVLTAYPYTSGK